MHVSSFFFGVKKKKWENQAKISPKTRTITIKITLNATFNGHIPGLAHHTRHNSNSSVSEAVEFRRGRKRRDSRSTDILEINFEMEGWIRGGIEDVHGIPPFPGGTNLSSGNAAFYLPLSCPLFATWTGSKSDLHLTKPLCSRATCPFFPCRA